MVAISTYPERPIPPLMIGAQGEWPKLAGCYLEALRVEQAYDFGPYQIARHRAEAQGALATFDDRLTNRSDDLTDLRCVAEEKLFFSPAPNLEALIWKISFARHRWREMQDWPDEWWGAVLADLHTMNGTPA